MKLIIPNEDLFKTHQELKHITGAIMALLEQDKRCKNKSIRHNYPHFCKLVDDVNKQMLKYAIKA